jgi:flagellar M-ring protein FliF
MDQLKSLLSSLTLRQQITIGVAALAVILGIYALAKWNKEKDFKPLYTSLAAEDAGAVVAHLKETGAEFRVSDSGGAILVPSGRVAETRLQMAALGLPKSGRIGYELFDKNNFGITDFTEQVNYHRALEGELERSVMALSEVESARVHLTLAKSSLFLESRQPAKASVMVKLHIGSKLSPQNVLAVTHLVASAVEGLQPESVSLLDMQGNLLSRPRKDTGPDGLEASDSAMEYRRRLESDMLAKINSTLEPVLGLEKFRAGVSIECDFTSGEQSDETYDPNKSVMVNSQKTEDMTGGSAVGGVPGSASNLPRPTSRPGSTGTGTTRKTETVTYQSSRTVRHVRLPQGGIKRMSVSVLVDHNVRWEGTGAKAKRIVEAPTPERLKTIHDLVAGATGLVSERGDQLIVETLPFTALNPEPPPGNVTTAPTPVSSLPVMVWPSSVPPALRNLPAVIGICVGALLIFIVAMYYRRKGKKKRAKVQSQKAIQGNNAVEQAANLRKQMDDKAAEQEALKEKQALEILGSLKVAPAKTPKAEVLSRHIAEETKRDPQAIANVLRGWMSER